MPTPRWLAALALAALLVAAPGVAAAERTVVVLFTGFGATPGGAGMDELATTLESAFGGDPARPFSGQVFPWTAQQQAFDYVNGFADLGCLVLVGHSFGANSAIELVTDFLAPAQITVDLLIQLDSVGASDDAVPAGVLQGINYYQVSTGLFEPQGESSVAGATNIQVEALYGVANSDISHTQIDCPLFDYTPSQYAALFGSQPDLHARIVDHITAACAIDVPALGRPGLAALVAALVAAAAVAAAAGHRRGAQRPSAG